MQSIKFFKKFIGNDSLAVLKKRSQPDELPCQSGNTTFRLNGNENAQGIALAGNFNEWNPQQLFFIKENGGWTCRINLSPGKYFYKFVIDRQWVLDPVNLQKEDDGQGDQKSVLIVKS